MTQLNHTWVLNGQPVGQITLAHGAGEQEQFAAQELASYFKEMSDAAIPIVYGIRNRNKPSIIILDASRPANRSFIEGLPVDQLHDDGYIIQSAGDDLFIVSKDPFGIVFGTYQYLARVHGCRFLDYAPQGEDVPRKQTLAHAPVSLLKNPKLAYRGMQMAVGMSRIDWMAKNGFNWNRLGAIHDLEWWTDKLNQMKPHLAKRGIRITFGHHMFHMLLPRKLYLEDHPDFFRSVDGVPTPQKQFYWSLKNQQALEEVIWRLEKFLRVHPEIEQLDFWPNDGLGTLDPEDYKALAGEPMPPEGEWVNTASGHREAGRLGDPRKAKVYALLAKQVAERLAVKFPELEIVLAAYVDLSQPCPDVKLPDNVAVTIAMYWRCYRHDVFESCTCNDQYRQIIREWLDVNSGHNLYLSEYYMGMGCHASLPYPVMSTLFREWPKLIGQGIRGAKVNTGLEVDTCVVPYNIHYHAFAAIAWDEYHTAESFTEQYCRDFFGPAWQPMYEMYLLWEESVQSAEHTLPGIDRFHAMLSEQAIARSGELIQSALALADNQKQRTRIERIGSLVEYARLPRPVSELLRQRDDADVQGNDTRDIDEKLIPQLRKLSDHFESLAQSNQNIVGVVRPTTFMNQDELKIKPNQWERKYAEATQADWVKDLFDPDVLRATRGK